MRLLVLVVALAGCLGPAATVCPNGGVCPPGLRCVAIETTDLCVAQTCGNGTVETGESCDDGNNVSGDACPATCADACGDGVRDVAAGEVCDDGNQASADGCSADCRSTETCGNGVLDDVAGEECDDGNLRSHDDCSSLCTVETLRWRSLDDAPTVDSSHSMVYDRIRGTVVLFTGNQLVPNQLGETWEWNGSRWRQRQPRTSPEQRVRPSMVFDTERGVVVMFGGSQTLNDVWEWDGTDWTRKGSQLNPPAMLQPAMAYDEARKLVVMLDSDGTGVWEWNGSVWTMRAATSIPASGLMTYHAARQRIVYVVGETTWELEGSSWMLRDQGNAYVSYRGSLVYDRQRAVVVMTPGELYGPTREWNGTSWRTVNEDPRTPVLFAGGPTYVSAVYDERLQRTVYFGRGTEPDLNFRIRATWLWDGTTWTRSRDREAAVPPASADARLVSGNASVLRVGPAGDLWEYNASSWSQQRAGAMTPGARTEAGVAPWVAVGSTGVMMLGGRNSSGVAVDEMWIGYLGMWQRVDGTPPARAEPGLATCGVHCALVFGGITDSAQLLADTWVQDGAPFTQLSPTTVPPARYAPLMAYDAARDRVVMFGGRTLSGPFVDVWEWDGSNWTARPAPPVSASTPRGLIYDSARSRIVLVDAHLWDWDGTTWTDRGAATALPRGNARTAAYDAKRQRIVVLAATGARNETTQAVIWNGTAWTSDTIEHRVPAARMHGAAAYDAARHVAVLFGGGERDAAFFFSTPALADHWEWNGVNWSQRSLIGGPDPRAGHGLVYDEARSRLVMFGGVGAYARMPTYEWNGATWLQITTVSPNIYSSAAAYHPSTQTVVSFGGGETDSNEMYTNHQLAYANGTWQSFDGMRPDARAGAAMAHDRKRERLVLFGGRSIAMPFGERNDIFEWDGQMWIAPQPAGNRPGARADHALVWDERRGRLVMFGGLSSGTALDDTWEWNGTAWTRLDVGTPGPRTHATLTNDPAGGLVLFGGARVFDANSNHTLTRETWFLRADDPRVPLEGCVAGEDGDGDGLVACDDPDCTCP